MGAWGWSSSSGPAADGKTTWEGETNMMGMKMKTREFETWVTPNKEIKIWGEASMDNGKSWQPTFEMTCKK
jgi:hypothetical protein